MRRISLVVLTILALILTPVAAFAGEAHSCAKATAEKSCCTKDAECCKDAKAACCKEAKACCDDKKCCTTAADGTHTCTMKKSDGTACTSPTCCKEGHCEKKTS